MKTKLLAVFAFYTLSAAAAKASIIEKDTYFAVDLHYSSVAYSKSVRSVVAHVGVLTQYPPYDGSRKAIWQTVKDIDLKQNVTGFTGSTALRAVGSDGSYKIQISPVIVYFVKFDDGTSTTSHATLISDEIGNDIGYSIQYEVQNFLDASKAVLDNFTTPTATRVALKATSFYWDAASSSAFTDLLRQSHLSSHYPD